MALSQYLFSASSMVIKITILARYMASWNKEYISDVQFLMLYTRNLEFAIPFSQQIIGWKFNLDLWKRRGQKANHSHQGWRDRPWIHCLFTYRETPRCPGLREPGTGEKSLGKNCPVAGGSAWASLKNSRLFQSWGGPHNTATFTSGSWLGSHSEHRRKIPSCFWHGEEKCSQTLCSS